MENRWHNFLEPTQIYSSFKDKLNDVAKKDETEQILRWIHGKMFFEGHVCQILNQLFGQRSIQERKRDIFQTCILPSERERAFSDSLIGETMTALADV